MANSLYFVRKIALAGPFGYNVGPISPPRNEEAKTLRKYLRNRPRARILSATLGESTNFHAYRTRAKVQILDFCNTPRVKMSFLQHCEFPEREPKLE